MTGREWIKKQFGVETVSAREFGSLVKDRTGNIYSYGYHYPLLFRVEGIHFRNVREYSTSTGRHISWSTGFNAIDVNLPSWYRTNSPHFTKLVDMEDYLKLERVRKINEMEGKRRKDTKIYHMLEEQLEDVTKRLATVTEIIEARA